MYTDHVCVCLYTHIYIICVIILFIYVVARIVATKENKEIWRLEKEIEELILEVVHHHKLKSQSRIDQNQEDLLHMIIENIAVDDDTANNNRAWGILRRRNHKRETQKLIVDICKNIYFAGSDTSALLLTWTLIQLSLHPQWQDCLRAEIFQSFPNISF